MALDPEFKAKWVAALRSGRYPQTRGMLRDCNGFCCLGVAGDILDPDGWRPDDAGNLWWHGYYDRLPDNDAGLIGLSDQASLDRMNDRGASFPEIANYIEKHL